MINTIFYFCPTQAEYDSIMDTDNGGEGISSKTIVFVEDTHEIYLNGVNYGKTSTSGLISDSDFTTWKNTVQTKLDQMVANTENDLTELQTELAEEITNAITDALKDSQGRSVWTRIDQTDSGVAAVTTSLNQMSVRLDGISNGGDIKYTAALQSVIDEGIENNTAFTNLQSRWAVLNENQAVLEWMASGFKTQVSQDTNFASVFSSWQGTTTNNTSTISAL